MYVCKLMLQKEVLLSESFPSLITNPVLHYHKVANQLPKWGPAPVKAVYTVNLLFPGSISFRENNVCRFEWVEGDKPLNR
jgi:hypothetical protein